MRELTICVVASAVLNAVFAATGKPVQNLPLKHEGYLFTGKAGPKRRPSPQDFAVVYAAVVRNAR